MPPSIYRTYGSVWFTFYNSFPQSNKLFSTGIHYRKLTLTILAIFPLLRSCWTAYACSTLSMETALTITTLSFSLERGGMKNRQAGVFLEQTGSFNTNNLQSEQASNNRAKSYCSRPSAGPPFSTSEMTMEVSPLWKWGLSRPPDIAIPKPNPGAYTE